MTIYQDCSHFYQLKNMTVGNIIKVSNSSDPDEAQYFVGPNLGPNCLQMLSVEKTLARVKRSCQKLLGYLKNNQHIWSLVLLYHDCSNYVNLSKMATRVICMSSHLFVCESETATVIDQIWFNLGLIFLMQVNILFISFFVSKFTGFLLL